MSHTVVAVLSDIHSNFYALKACFEDAVQCSAERFLFLGDYISDLSEAEQTMDLVYSIRSSYPTICLRGNREAYMLDCHNGISHFSQGSKTGSLLYTYDHLREQDLDFFRSLPISDTVEIGGVCFEIAHAAMEDDRFYFDSSHPQIDGVFSRMKCDYFITGHSHKQYTKSCAGKTIINPGSVGIPQGGNRWSSYALLEITDGKVTCNFRQVTYDLCDVIRAQFRSELMDYAKYWAIGILYDVITGQEQVLSLLAQVQKNGGPYDEEIWERTAIGLGMKLTEPEILAICKETANAQPTAAGASTRPTI